MKKKRFVEVVVDGEIFALFTFHKDNRRLERMAFRFDHHQDHVQEMEPLL